MATPMQYELINTLFRALATTGVADGRVFFHSDDEARNTYTPNDDRYVIQSWREMAGAIRFGAPLVDCSDVWRQLATPVGEMTHWNIQMFRDAMRPWSSSENANPPCPWPCAIFSADLGGGEVSMWCVIDADDVRAAASSGVTMPDHLVGVDFGGRTYLVSMFALTMVDGRLAATRLKEQPSVKWIGLSKWALCTRLTLAYAAAKNARWAETAPDRKTRKHSPAVAGIRFRHIEIDMGKAKPKSKHAPDYKSEGVPWHHRRGHWAFYGEDKPLFGRKGEHGWFWRPFTEVGDKAHGEIVQDYSVVVREP